MIKRIVSAILSTAIAVSAMSVSSFAQVASAETSDFTDYNQNQIVYEMGGGWNLGNSLDSFKETTDQDGNITTVVGETLWSNPIITKEFIENVKAEGYNTIRIPVSYYSMIGEAPDYKIDTDYLNRVQEVVDYAYDLGMYVIINIHHDGASDMTDCWIYPGVAFTKADKDKVLAAEKIRVPKMLDKFSKVWAQISTKFKDYDEHMIFESMNEVQSKGGGAYYFPYYMPVLNSLNQTFVDTVRRTGGHNDKRWVVIPSWHNDYVYLDQSTGFKVPTDNYLSDKINGEHRIMVSCHYYFPYNMSFGNQTTWGTESDYADIENDFKWLYDNYTSKGYPVFLGEYGTQDRKYLDSKNEMYRALHNKAICETAIKYNIVPVWWDNGGIKASKTSSGEKFGLFQRSANSIYYPQITKAVREAYNSKNALRIYMENISQLVKDDYSKSTWDDLQSAIASANTLLNNSESTDEECDTAIRNYLKLRDSKKETITSKMVKSISNKTYSGKAQSTTVVIKQGTTTLKNGTDYKVTYKNNTNVGTATATITGIGNYKGTITKTFKINPKKLTSTQFSLSTTKYGYTGTSKKPTVKSSLKLNKDYTVSYSNNLYVGTAKVTIKGKGNYSGTITKTFKIVKPTAPGTEKVTKLTAGKKTVTVTYAKKTGVKYKVLLSSNKSFKGAKKILTSKTSVKFTKLTSGKKYYVKVCAYKTYKTSKTKTGYVYGKYSSINAVRAK